MDARWENVGSVPLWAARTEHMLGLLKGYLGKEAEKPLYFLELGCGSMETEKLLPKYGLGHFLYLPSDCYRRDARTLVVDLDDPCFLDSSAPSGPLQTDIAFLGGVLEYLQRPGDVLRRLAGCARFLFFSYCPDMPQVALGEAGMTAVARSLGRLSSECNFGPAPYRVYTFFVETGTCP
jgi:hypothetical protein